MKRFSIITINLNNRDGLAATIASVVGQAFRDFEFLVIDGGSHDGSIDLLRENNDGISTWISEKDNGIFNAQNKGIEVATGEYLLFLNSGDFLCGPSVLQEANDRIHGEDIVYGDMRINWGGGNVTTGTSPDVVTVEHMFLDTIWHPVSFIRRDLFTRFGKYDERYRMVADYEFFFRVLIAGKVTSRHIPLEVCEYRADGFSSQKKYKRLERAERKRVQRRYLSPEEIKKLAPLRRRAWFKRLLRRIFGR